MNKRDFGAIAAVLLSLAFGEAAQANPTYYLQQKLNSTVPAAGNLLGNAVAVSGTIALVAANDRTVNFDNGRGAVYVYTYANQTWTQTAVLRASDGAAGDSFGTSVALSGSTAIIGAPFHAGGGAAYIFTRSGSTWTQTAELTASDGVSGDEFGFTVSLDGATAVVGALGKNGFQGAAYVYTKPGSAWASTSAFTAELTASDGAALDEFGFSVAVKGATVAVGAPEHMVVANAQQGQVYVFVMPGGGWATTSVATALLTSSDGGAGDQFGYAVAASASAILVGAPTHKLSARQPGAAYLYAEPIAGWATTSTWAIDMSFVVPSTATGGLFGNAVALTNSTAVVGAKWATTQGHGQQGVAYVYKGASGSSLQKGIASHEMLWATDGVAKAAFGYSVATDGVIVTVGAPHYITSKQSVAGEAYGFNATQATFEFNTPGRVAQGQTYSIEAEALNPGTTRTQDVQLSVAVLSGARVISASSTAAKCRFITLKATCDFGNLAPGAGVWMTVNFADTAVAGKHLTTVVTLVGSTPLSQLSSGSLLVTAP